MYWQFAFTQNMSEADLDRMEVARKATVRELAEFEAIKLKRKDWPCGHEVMTYLRMRVRAFQIMQGYFLTADNQTNAKRLAEYYNKRRAKLEGEAKAEQEALQREIESVWEAAVAQK